jgi:hypothetical protein
MTTMRKLGWLTMTMGAAVVLLCCGGAWTFQSLYLLTFGWVSFLARVAPEIRPDGSAIGMGIISLAFFTLGLHWFLAWFHAAVSQKSLIPNDDPVSQPTTGGRAWSVRWTLSIVAIIVMMFVAGISMVGITHQVTWMATAKQPLINNEIRGAARRMQSGNNLKHIVVALQDYHDANSSLPPGETVNGEGRHSWQTVLLPYCQLNQLYEQVVLTEPWETERHRKVFTTEVRPYLSPHPALLKLDGRGYALSHYAANRHVISGTNSSDFSSMTDGMANTILCGEAAGNFKPWGESSNRRDPAKGINTSPDGFGSPWSAGGAIFVFADGHTQFISDKVDPQVLKALATPAGGEVVGEY